DLRYLINHVFLPPRLPESNDTRPGCDDIFVGSLLSALQKFSELQAEAEEESAVLNCSVKMLKRLSESMRGSKILDKKESVKIAVEELSDGGMKFALFHVRSQNAGLLLSGETDHILVQAFELRPDDKSVTSCPGRLVREFPDRAVRLPRATLQDHDFLEEFVDVLCKLEMGDPAGRKPKDGSSPVLLTGLLMGVLAGLGQNAPDAAKQVRKKTREVVHGSDVCRPGTKLRLPFRRSPLWLLLRAGLQLQLGGTRRSLYKAVITFFHVTLLDRAGLFQLPSDLRFVMSAKVAHRIVKLNPDQEQEQMLPWLETTERILERNREDLDKRWEQIQVKDASRPKVAGLGDLSFQADCKLKLSKLEGHEMWMDSQALSSSRNRPGSGGDDRKHTRYSSTELPDVPDEGIAEFALLEVEAWVEMHLDSWLARRRLVKDGMFHADMGNLQQLALKYHKKASAHYKGVQEALSLVYLVIMEIWIAVDKMGGDEVPLLLEYDPGFSSELFHALLLPTRSQMVRLQKVEHHLSSRRAVANNSYSLIFSGFGQPESFAVRFFDSCSRERHRKLRQEIVKWAKKTKSNKRLEYTIKRKAYDEDEGDFANSFTIDIFEWPLPQDENQTKAIVFEISVPDVVAIWRDMTTFILRDVPGNNKKRQNGADVLFYAAEQPAFRHFLLRTSQVQLACVIDPALRIQHQNTRNVSEVTKDDVCLDHPYQYDYYDSVSGLSAAKLFQTARALPAHSSKPPLGPWIRGTGHTSNEVIVEQHRCPQVLSLDQFRAFGHLRSGMTLQWASLLCQLTIPSLDWNQPSTFALVMQACTEAGPPKGESALREAHSDLADTDFVEKLISALRESFQRVCWNWQNTTALGLFVCVAVRILSLTADSQESCRLGTSATLLDLLGQARKTSIKWTRSLIAKRAAMSWDDERQDLDVAIMTTSLISVLTFDLPPHSLAAVLPIPGHLRYLVEAAISVHHYSPTKKTALGDPVLRHLWHRRHAVIYRACTVIQREVTEHQRLIGLSSGVRKFWGTCPHSAVWKVRGGEQGHILDSVVTMVGGTGQATIRRVSWNSLTGQLLVDGLRVDRLPRKFEKHPMYREVFKNRILEVMRSEIPEMQYSADVQSGWVAHFSSTGSNIVIRCVHLGTTWELIPASCFVGDLPNFFVKGYTHWKNLTTGEIEFRPTGEPWKTSPKLWILKREADHWVLRRRAGPNDTRFVVDRRSRTASSLFKILRPIEPESDINIIFHQNQRHVVAELPQLSLAFILGEGKSIIKSKQYSGMMIAEDQAIGTLIGLKSRLVLRTISRQTDNTNVKPPRVVLVPHGTVVAMLDGDHVQVEIQRRCTSDLNHHVYDVNETLGCLNDKGSLSSKLFLSLLHAFTSHCLPDPFTGRTGTDEALRLLSSAGVKSFERLDEGSQGLLRQIARISPRRAFCRGKGSVEMESSVWQAGLPALAQYDGFWRAVRDILKHVQDCEVLLHHGCSASSTTGTMLEKKLPQTQFLADQALVRNSIFRPSGFGAEAKNSGRGADVKYENRAHSPEAVTKFRQTLAVTSIVRTGSRTLLTESPSPECLRTMILALTGTEFKIPSDASSLQFDFKNLESPSRVLAGGRWCQVYNSLHGLENKYRKAFFLSSLLYADSSDIVIVQTLMAAMHGDCCVLAEIQSPSGVDVGFPWTCYFRVHIDRLSSTLHQMDLWVPPAEEDENVDAPMRDAELEAEGFIREGDLFHREAPNPGEIARPIPQSFIEFLESREDQANDALRPLDRFLSQLSQKGSLDHHHSYIDKLRESSRSPKDPGSREMKLDSPPSPGLQAKILQNLQNCQREAEAIYGCIARVLRPSSAAERLSWHAGLYPRLSPIFLLQQLSNTRWEKLPRDSEWRECLVNYALALIYLQRAERLFRCCRLSVVDRNRHQTQLLQDMANSGYYHGRDAVDPLQHPERLILEIEQGILIRPVQHQIAASMCRPPSGDNHVMQLNMGQGKSSVIVPIVAAALADGEQLVRIIVAKPQSKQMMHTLVRALGGLQNRQVMYLPFRRDINPNRARMRTLESMLIRCKKDGGVLLVQPEHLLSFKLKGLEMMCSEIPNSRSCGPESSLGRDILGAYLQFEEHSRDIVDESDENLSVRFELIYTIGRQQPVDMSPSRWVVIQELMDVIALVVEELYKDGLTEGLLFQKHAEGGRFPTIRILNRSAGNRLVQALAAKLSTGGLRGFPMHNQPQDMQASVRRYIKYPDVPDGDIARVEDVRAGIFQQEGMKKVLLLLRGLFSGGIFRFVLGQQRFRVNYGLTRDRQPTTMLAVPYRAKDSPSPRSEFSHTDVVIILTCLSYYYQGLKVDELLACFGVLGDSGQAELEYGRWSAAVQTLPMHRRSIRAVNLKDRPLFEADIFPFFRFAKPTIDFYLANIVFPREMRDFPFKLSSSGWDLAKPKTHPLTGFSGTTDSQYLLPLSVQTLDIPAQRHTNASVIASLLESGNSVLELGQDQASLCALSAEVLIKAVTESVERIPVILDVGAQIIEHGNREFASEWLRRVRDVNKDAVVFFNDQDELSVLSRAGVVEPFLTSPFVTQTERCLVFLDQAHTRGTDLRLPDTYRAAVTLGPGVTKDTLVQACMRMRKLGHGQTVTFCISGEMQKRIREFCKVNLDQPISVSDVLTFSISETWNEIQRNIPLWAIQGIRHQRQESIWARASETGELTSRDVRNYLEPEAQSIEQRYPPASNQTPQTLESRFEEAVSQLPSRREQLDLIYSKCINFDLPFLTDKSNPSEQQERELAPEAIQQPQIERPPPAVALPHSLHPGVLSFVQTGMLPRSQLNTSVFLPAYGVLKHSSVWPLYSDGTRAFPTDLLVTVDFAWTVENDGPGKNGDAFQRPVQWVLTKRVDTSVDRFGMHMVIISPWEANEIKPMLESSSDNNRQQSGVTMHAYLPRPSRGFMTMEDLTTFTVPKVDRGWAAPRELVMQLNLFAGQLCLRSYREYARLCRYLGLRYRDDADADGDGDVEMRDAGLPRGSWAPDGWVGRAGGSEFAGCPFDFNPVPFLRVLYKRIRGGCLDIERTHMGRILAGEVLTMEDF
ncbi:hypothetical protein QBC42DRAFT_330868, partial [Cladorrhinum samala]